ncbi:hypothetical protein, partial [Desulfobulbus elongatus]|uniref:hypothetical protein n=1 Tax=Desulfobulbus elongatus TaxID=53332 RepID=UPI00054EF725
MKQWQGKRTGIGWLPGLAGILLCLFVSSAAADDFSDYKTSAGSTAVVNLPMAGGPNGEWMSWFTAVDYFPSGTTAMIDGRFEAEGRMIAATGREIYLQRTYGSSKWDVVATVPYTMDPSFIHVSPDGSRIALGVGYVAPLLIIPTTVLSATAPPDLTTHAAVKQFPLINYYDGDWVEEGDGIDANRYFVVNGGQWPSDCEPPYDSNPYCSFASGVGAVDTEVANPATHVGVPLIIGIPGASSDVDVDKSGNLLTGIGYLTSPNRTGEVKVWPAGGWDPVNGSSLAYEGNTRIVAANILSAAYLGEDAEGNFHIGGADAFGVGGPPERGYAALIKAGIVNAIATGARTTPVTDGNRGDTSEYKYFAPDPCQDDSATGILAGDWGRGLAVMWNPTYYETNGSCAGDVGSAADYWNPGVTPR